MELGVNKTITMVMAEVPWLRGEWEGLGLSTQVGIQSSSNHVSEAVRGGSPAPGLAMDSSRSCGRHPSKHAPPKHPHHHSMPMTTRTQGSRIVVGEGSCWCGISRGRRHTTPTHSTRRWIRRSFASLPSPRHSNRHHTSHGENMPLYQQVRCVVRKGVGCGGGACASAPLSLLFQSPSRAPPLPQHTQTHHHH